MSVDTKGYQAAQYAALKKRLDYQANLPHKYGQKLYPWQRAFKEDFNRMNFLTAANQVGKSTIQIKKCVDWATETTLWPKLWSHRPRIFWYLYPSAELATIEFEEKWVPDIMPRNEMKTDKKYGWRADYDSRKKIRAIYFNSGITVYFKFYSVRAPNLQATTVDAIFCDEELPEVLYSEFNARLIGSRGYFSMVFTPTLNQMFWYFVMEMKGKKGEKFPQASKRQISLYDSMFFEDGAPSRWTAARIQEVIDECKSDLEVQRRVYGRFVSEEGLKYGSFNFKLNCMDPREIPDDWSIHSGVDPGSGGLSGHPAAISFVAVNPELTKGEVFLGWRGDGIDTTAGDVYDNYVVMKTPFKEKIRGQRYDYHAKDFYTIAERQGDTFDKANKNQEEGSDVVNTLFKYQALTVHLTEELWKLVLELQSIKKGVDKRTKGDDFADSLRYCVISILWDWARIKVRKKKKVEEPELSIDDQRRRAFSPSWRRQVKDEMRDEITYWNDLIGR